jgi:hypothetical protein
MKVQKEDDPARPVINWMNVPADTLATQLVPSSERHATLPYSFDIRNTAALRHNMP